MFSLGVNWWKCSKIQTWMFIVMVIIIIMKKQKKEKNLGNFKNEELFYTLRGMLGVFETL